MTRFFFHKLKKTMSSRHSLVVDLRAIIYRGICFLQKKFRENDFTKKYKNTARDQLNWSFHIREQTKHNFPPQILNIKKRREKYLKKRTKKQFKEILLLHNPPIQNIYIKNHLKKMK